MSNSNSIATILEDLNNSYHGDSEKTASDESGEDTEKEASSGVEQKRQELKESLDGLVSGQTKQASENQRGNDATEELEKLANDLAQSDLQASIKEAHTFGAAVFDGFVARANEYAGNTGGEKTASAGTDPREHEHRVKTAAQIGYQTTGQILDSMMQQEKVAYASEEQGIVDALEKIAAASEDCFVRGVQHMNNVAQRLG